MIKWAEQGIRTFRWYDMSLVKLSTAAFILMIAKLWEPLLMLDWYWYLVIAIVAAIPPMMRMCCQRD